MKSIEAENKGLSVTLFDRMMKAYGKEFSIILRT